MTTGYLDERTYQTGDIIFAEGDTSTEMFIVQEGKVVVTKHVTGRDVFLATLDRGDFFGEIALLDSQPRTATCVAIAPTRLLAIRSGELLVKLRRDPTFALEMLHHMSQRLRHLNNEASRLLEEQVRLHDEFAKIATRSEFRIRPDQR